MFGDVAYIQLALNVGYTQAYIESGPAPAVATLGPYAMECRGLAMAIDCVEPAGDRAGEAVAQSSDPAPSRDEAVGRALVPWRFAGVAR